MEQLLEFISPGLIWFFVGCVFLVIEFMVPAFVCIFFTAGSWITAATCSFTNTNTQFVIFIMSSLAILFLLRVKMLNTFKGSVGDQTADVISNIGQRGIVTEEIKPGGIGEIKMLGTFWRATASETLSLGQNVIVTKQVDSLTYEVKDVDNSTQSKEI